MKEALVIPQIIFDTDMETDCDDAGALAILANSVISGKAKLLAVIADVPSKYAAAASEAILQYYGITCEVGAVPDKFSDEHPGRFSDYINHRKKYSSLSFNDELSKRVGKTDVDYDSSTNVYRRALSRAKANSVTIVVLGTMTAFDLLLSSEADGYSDLSGIDLVREKVSRIVVMTNSPFPQSDVNFNWDMDPVAAEHAVHVCPLPMVCSDFGDSVITGVTLASHMPQNQPVRYAYEKHNGGEGKGRSSWDLIALLYALEPDLPYFDLCRYGMVSYDSKKHVTFWQEKGERYDTLLRVLCSTEEIEKELENRMVSREAISDV